MTHAEERKREAWGAVALPAKGVRGNGVPPLRGVWGAAGPPLADAPPWQEVAAMHERVSCPCGR